MRSQTDQILAHLLKGKSLTPKQAAKMPFCCWRLSARIHEIRNRGYVVETSKVRYRSHRTGRQGTYARYFMPDWTKQRIIRELTPK